MARIFRPAKKQPVSKAQQVTVTIDRLSDDGRGVAKQQGKTLFISGALVGETVTARIIASSARFDEAVLVDVVEASPQRIASRCSHFNSCGGCDLQHFPLLEQQHHKQRVLAQQLRHWAENMQPQSWLPPLTAEGYGYRQRLRLAVTNHKGRNYLGFRQKTSKHIVAINECPVMDLSLQSLITPLNQWLQHTRVAVTHIECLATENGAGLVLRHTAPISLADRAALAAIVPESCQLWFQGEKNADLDDVHGQTVDPRLSYLLPDYDLRLHFHPQDFIQGNAAVNQLMVAQVLTLLKPQAGEHIVDLFCGIGNFSLPLSRYCQQVTAVEGVAEMVTRGQENARANGCHNIVFQQSDLSAANVLNALKIITCDGLLLDPPRSGAEAVCQQMTKLLPKRIVYVSCNSATFARDAHILGKQGYILDSAGVVDMFPQTAHSEVMGLFVHGA